jgi:hypothetical protein
VFSRFIVEVGASAGGAEAFGKLLANRNAPRQAGWRMTRDKGLVSIALSVAPALNAHGRLAAISEVLAECPRAAGREACRFEPAAVAAGDSLPRA